MSCARARETLSAELDGEASEADVLDAVRHVRRCRACWVFVLGVGEVTRALRASTVMRPSSAGQPR